MSRSTHIVVCAALGLASLALYWPTTDFDFVNLDDHGYVLENKHLSSGLSPSSLGWIVRPHHSNWVPLTWLSFAFDYEIGGLDPAVYHRTNVLLHAAAVVLLYLALAALTRARWRSAWVAAVFALHPLHVESVAWIAERKDVLVGVCFALCLLAYASYARQAFSLPRYLAVVLAFTLGLLSKATLVTLPFLLLLLDYWPLGRLRESPRRALLEKIPLVCLSAAVAAITVVAGAEGEASPMTLAQRLANVALGYVHYLRLAFWPDALAVYYPYPGASVSLPKGAAAAAGLAAATAIAWWWRSRPAIWVGWLWFLGMLVPTIGIVLTPGPQAMADRFTYLPLVGLTIAVAWAVPDRLSASAPRRYAVAAVAALLLAAMGVRSFAQLEVWRGSTSLFSHAIAVTEENAVAHLMLGIELARAGQEEEARQHFGEAQRTEPSWGRPPLMHGRVLAVLGDNAGARDQYALALEATPGWSAPLVELSRLDLAERKPRRAIRRLREVLAGAAGDERADVCRLLGRALASIGELGQAASFYRQSLALRPDRADVRAELGLLLLARKEPGAASRQLLAAELQGHSNADAYFATANLHFERSAEEAGIAALRRTVALRPDFAVALNALSWRLATARDPALRDPAEALGLARTAVDLTARRNPEVLDTLAAALAASGDFPGAVAALDEALPLVATPDRASAMRRQRERYRRRRR